MLHAISARNPDPVTARFSRNLALTLALTLAPLASMALLVLPAPLRAQEGPACTDTMPFRLERVITGPVANLDEPLKMDFDMDAEGRVDIYFVEKKGRLRRYDARTGQVRELGLPANVWGTMEGGLTGIALDPGFKQNRRLFLGHTAPTRMPGAQLELRVTRYALGADGLLDPASAKVLISIPGMDRYHSSVVLKFDGEGNLFVAIGDNGAGDEGPSNTNDLRGKILRIRPTEDGSYTVPAGNLFSPGTAATRPEIYVMGARQPYALAYDPGLRRLAWGEFGPDGTMARTEEHNVTDRPGNFGWPHFAGRQFQMYREAPRDPAAPANLSLTQTGLKTLPPAIPAVHVYGQSGSVTGPLYRTPSGNPLHRLPAGFDGIWFLTDFNKGWVDTVRLDSSGTVITAQGRLPGLKFNRPVEFQQGPDGGFYVINYAGSYSYSPDANISRLVYQGCQAVAVAPAPGRFGDGRWTVRRGNVHVTGGGHRIALRNLTGRLLGEFRGEGAATYDLARIAGGRPGVYLVEFASAGNRQARRVALTGP